MSPPSSTVTVVCCYAADGGGLRGSAGWLGLGGGASATKPEGPGPGGLLGGGGVPRGSLAGGPKRALPFLLVVTISVYSAQVKSSHPA